MTRAHADDFAAWVKVERLFADRVRAATDHPDDAVWKVYQDNATVVRLRALALIFPICLRVVGQACFDAVAKQYVAQHPLCGHTLDDDGVGFAQVWASFVESNPAFVDYAYLPDLARYERIHHDVTMAWDTPTFDWQCLSMQSEETLADSIPYLSATFGWIETRWPVLALYHDADVVIDEEARGYWVHRSARCIERGYLNTKQLMLLSALAQQMSLGQLYDIGIDQSLLSAFVASGWIAGIQLPNKVCFP